MNKIIFNIIRWSNRLMIKFGERIYSYENKHCMCIKLLDKEKGLLRLVGGTYTLNIIMFLFLLYIVIFRIIEIRNYLFYYF